MSKIIIQKTFDERDPAWQNDPDFNALFVKCNRDYMYAKLKAQGYLFLNDVYEVLGLPKTRRGQVGGWIFDEEKTEGDLWTAETISKGSHQVELLTFTIEKDILNALPNDEEEL